MKVTYACALLVCSACREQKLDIRHFPTRHNYGLALLQQRIEQLLAGWVEELAVPIYREREVTGFDQDDTGVDVALSDGRSLNAKYLVGCDGRGSQAIRGDDVGSGHSL